MTQSTNQPTTQEPTDDELAALYRACERRDAEAADEIAAAVNVRLGIGDNEPTLWMFDLLAAGIAAQLADGDLGGQDQAAAA
jgi:hypothetical protein